MSILPLTSSEHTWPAEARHLLSPWLTQSPAGHQEKLSTLNEFEPMTPTLEVNMLTSTLPDTKYNYVTYIITIYVGTIMLQVQFNNSTSG